MQNAQLSLDLGESITVSDDTQQLYVFVWREPTGLLSVSVNRGKPDRDNIQIRYANGKLVTVASPEGEPVSLAECHSSAALEPDADRPCLSWRRPGGLWCLHEDGEGERMRLKNTGRGMELSDLSDRDLMEIHDLISHAIRARRISKP